MITMPYDKVKERIQEQNKLSEQEIENRVAQKLSSLSGLISREGAIHIVANELGVKLMPDRDKLKVKDLLGGMRSISLPVRVLRLYELREFTREGRQGKVASFLAGDETGIVRVTLWNEQTELFARVQEGLTVLLKDVNVKENQGRVEIHLQTGSELIISPPGITVEASTSATARSYKQKKIGELSGNEDFVDILGTIVQVFDPRTFQKRTGGEGLVVSAIIDDSTGTIRASFWDDDARQLVGDAIGKADALGDAKLELLGQIVKVQGRCKLNTTYNTLELSVSSFVKNPDPQAEMARLG